MAGVGLVLDYHRGRLRVSVRGRRAEDLPGSRDGPGFPQGRGHHLCLVDGQRRCAGRRSGLVRLRVAFPPPRSDAGRWAPAGRRAPARSSERSWARIRLSFARNRDSFAVSAWALTKAATTIRAAVTTVSSKPDNNGATRPPPRLLACSDKTP